MPRIVTVTAAAVALTFSGLSAGAVESTYKATSTATPEAAWKKIGDFCGIATWHPAVEKCVLSDDGKKRTLSLKGGGTIVETLVGLARDLRMQIVAEGVEQIEQVEYLRDHGISAVQGYVFAPPLPRAAFISLIEATDPLGSGREKQRSDETKNVTAAFRHLAAA